MKFDLNWAGLMAQGYFAGLPERISRIADSDDEYPQNPGFSAPVRECILGHSEALTRLTFINQCARQGLPFGRTPASQVSGPRCASHMTIADIGVFSMRRTCMQSMKRRSAQAKRQMASALRSEIRYCGAGHGERADQRGRCRHRHRRGGDRVPACGPPACSFSHLWCRSSAHTSSDHHPGRGR